MSVAYISCPYCYNQCSYNPDAPRPPYNTAILLTCPKCHNMFSFDAGRPLHSELVINDPERAFTAPVDAPDPAEILMKQVESAEAATVETEEIAQSESE